MGQSSPAVVVLLEGGSDVAAVDALLAGHEGADTSGRVDLVDMGGVTNFHRHLRELVASGEPRRLLGMCDAGEASHFVRALSRNGLPVESASDLEACGFHVCDRDLEEELIRALGPERTIGVLEGLGLAAAFAGFRGQLAWRDRDLRSQLQRFAGAKAGRKALLARAYARALTLEQAPRPLRMLLRHIEQAGEQPTGPPLRPFPG